MLLQVKGWYKLLSSAGLKKFCACFYHAPNILFDGHKIWCTKTTILFNNTLKRNEVKVYISLKGNKLACFANSKGSFQLRVIFMHLKSQETRHAKNLRTKISNSFSF